MRSTIWRADAAISSRATRAPADGPTVRTASAHPTTARAVGTAVSATRTTKIRCGNGSAIFVGGNLGIRCACDNSTRVERGTANAERGTEKPGAAPSVPRSAFRLPRSGGYVKAHTHYLWFNTKQRQEIIDVTEQVAAQVAASGVKEGFVLVSAMHITASVMCMALTRDRKSTRLNSSHRCISYA